MAGPNTREFTEGNFEQEVLSAGEPVLVDFWAEWCGPCKALGPVIDDLATEYAGKAKIGKVNTDQNQHLAAQYGVASIPTVLVLQKGEIKHKMTGFRGPASKKELQMILDQLLAAPV